MDVVFSLIKIFREKRAIRTGRQKFLGEFFPRTEVGVVDLDQAVVLFAEMKRILSCKLKNYPVSSAARLISNLEGLHRTELCLGVNNQCCIRAKILNWLMWTPVTANRINSDTETFINELGIKNLQVMESCLATCLPYYSYSQEHNSLTSNSRDT
jgi:hypothetical protein